MSSTGFKCARSTKHTEPGVIKAFHVHKRQYDVWYVPPEDRVLLVLVDLREEAASRRTVLKVLLAWQLDARQDSARGGPRLQEHRNGTAHLIYFTSEHFSPEPATTDEGRLPWDLAAGTGAGERPGLADRHEAGGRPLPEHAASVFRSSETSGGPVNLTRATMRFKPANRRK
jgi:hypothetical protein